MNADIISKLQKILAKADPARGATEAEAQAAMALAQRLAIQHNIDLATVAAKDAEGVSIETDRVDIEEGTTNRRLHHRPIAQVLMYCFDVLFIWQGTGSRCAIIGEKADVAIAAYCWPWLNRTYLELFRQFSRTNFSRFTEHVQRKSFYEGLTVGIMQNNQRQKAAAKAEGGDAYALVIVKKEEAVAARANEEFPSAGKVRSRKVDVKRMDHAALARGYEAGKKIKLNSGLTVTEPELALT